MYQLLRSALCVVFLFVMGLTSIPAVAADTVPRYEKAKCKFEVPKDYPVECGYLIVPEDRKNPDGRTIKLHVAVFKAKAKKAAQDAVIYLEGGPGGHALENARFAFDAVFKGYAQKRDFIMFDQRGVGYSEPSLDCPEATKASYEGITKQMPYEQKEQLEIDALKACRDRLVKQGIDLSAYNSAANAADVNDLWKLLGYKEINLYGISYGTRLALTVMRDFPKGVRSVILDSTVPLQTDLYGKIPFYADRAFKVFFQGCLKDRQCNAAYPNLDKVFYDLVAKFNLEPASITVKQPYTGKKFDLLIDGHDLVNMVFNSLYSTEVIVYFPKIIFDTYDGNYDLLEKLMGGSLVQHEYVSAGMYYSVQCAEELPFTSKAALENADRTFPKLQSAFNMVRYQTVCDLWNVKPAPAVENQPVTSTIYTLVLSGQYDPITPPSYGWLASQTLKHSWLYEFPGIGHGVSVGARCPYQVALKFIDEPTKKPDIGCISTMTEPRFYVKSSLK